MLIMMLIIRNSGFLLKCLFLFLLMHVIVSSRDSLYVFIIFLFLQYERRGTETTVIVFSYNTKNFNLVQVIWERFITTRSSGIQPGLFSLLVHITSNLLLTLDYSLLSTRSQ
jgi:hypothetical protein